MTLRVEPDVHAGRWLVFNSEDEMVVAMVFDEKMANLIAAAPQLLGALELLLTHPSDDPLDAWVTEGGYLLTPLQIAKRNARSTIAAAKGEQ